MSALDSNTAWALLWGARPAPPVPRAAGGAVVQGVELEGSAPGADARPQDVPAAPASGSAAAPPRTAPAGQLPRSWFRDHFDTLWRIALRLGVPGHSVDDVVQEAFITASRRRADIGEGQERRFLISTVVRVSSNYRQRASVRHELAESELEQRASTLPDAEQLLIEKRARQELESALAGLSDEQRSVFVLYELEGFSVREIAELLALPSGTVASRLGRARTHFSRAVTRLQSLAAAPPRRASEPG
jgi:RNA polymerase sigma-70 factor (ECF subfamily)